MIMIQYCDDQLFPGGEPGIPAVTVPAAVAQTITTTTSKNKEVQNFFCKKTTRPKEALQNNQKIKQCF